MGNLNPLWLVAGSAALAVIPIFIGVASCYLKVSIVFSMLKNALGAQQVPGALVVMALSLSITGFVMAPVISETLRIIDQLSLGSLDKTPTLSSLQKLAPCLKPWEEFLESHVGQKEKRVLLELAQAQPKDQSEKVVGTSSESGLRVLIPAFMLTELKLAFSMGFVLLLPFLVIDLVVANILVGMGMMMVSPVMISLPLKLLLFVSADGWILLTKSLILSYQ